MLIKQRGWDKNETERERERERERESSYKSGMTLLWNVCFPFSKYYFKKKIFLIKSEQKYFFGEEKYEK